MTHRFVVALALAFALACTASCSAVGVNTQVMVTVDAESGVQSASHNLVVRVFGGPRGADPSGLDLLQEIPAPVSPGVGWPTTVALAPLDRDATRIYRVEAAAYDVVNVGPTSVPIATVRAISGYVPNQTVWLRLLIQDDCIGIPCVDLTTTCEGGLCVTADRPPSSLPLWGSDAGTASDAGMDAARTDADLDGGPDAWVPCTATSCDDGLSCTDDFCGATGCVHFPSDARCDDTNGCTDDHCDGTTGNGCTHMPNSASCTDGMFCNGLDQCGGGMCSVHPGNPCGTRPCTEATSDCGACSTVADCPAPTYGSWSTCGYAGVCATSGTQTRTTRTFACEGSMCVPHDGNEVTACGTRTTDGTTCATSSCDAPGPCYWGATCDQTGSAPQTCHDFRCSLGTCADMFFSSSMTCSRSTNTLPCDDGNTCTSPDACNGGICSGTPICDGGIHDAGGGCFDDGIACTRESISDAGLCVHQPDDSYCNDFSTCSTERCDPFGAGRDSGGCTHDYSGCMPDGGAPRDAGIAPCVFNGLLCEDHNPCTFDSCAPDAGSSDAYGCMHVITTCPGLDGAI